MNLYRLLLISLASLLLSGCDNEGEFNLGSAIATGVSLFQAATLEDSDVQQAASLSAARLDQQHPVATASNPYTKRLEKLTRNLREVDGLPLNYKVYLSPKVNAFAMADGTIRIYSGLMDAMPDDQLLAVISHEIGHVKLQHSFQQMRQQLLTNAVFQAAHSAGGDIAVLSQSELGDLAYRAIGAGFSRGDELAADAYAQQLLQQLGTDPAAMIRAITTLQTTYGEGGGFLSTHPSNPKRLETLKSNI